VALACYFPEGGGQRGERVTLIARSVHRDSTRPARRLSPRSASRPTDARAASPATASGILRRSVQPLPLGHSPMTIENNLNKVVKIAQYGLTKSVSCCRSNLHLGSN
jgi:hypothetical protein